MREQFLYAEKYRPRTLKDTILPPRLREQLQSFVDQGDLPNLILSGSSGVGKTTSARAMVEELGSTCIVINGSLSRNIDTLRTDIKTFASSMSLDGKRKYVILDEADYLNPQSTMPALRNFMEEYSRNCGFIMTCNFINRIIPALQSRCTTVEFKLRKDERRKMAGDFFNRVKTILDTEGVGYDPKVVAELVQRDFPDFRKVLNELQGYTAIGDIDAGILARGVDVSINTLIALIKDNDFTGARKWIVENLDNNVDELFRRMYEVLYTSLKPDSVPQMVLIIAKYQYQGAFVSDPEINMMACITEIMVDTEFK